VYTTLINAVMLTKLKTGQTYNVNDNKFY